MISQNTVLQWGDTEIVPLRAIPFITGGDLGPRRLATILADETLGLEAFVLAQDGSAREMLPKEWKQFKIRLSHAGKDSPDLIDINTLSVLPSSTFVYRENLWRTYEALFLPDRESLHLATVGEQKNSLLQWMANIPNDNELICVVFKGFESLIGPELRAHVNHRQTQPRESKEQREDRRLKACIDAGLTLPPSHHGRLPNGVGALAQTEGISRQAFSADVKAALERQRTPSTSNSIIHKT